MIYSRPSNLSQSKVAILCSQSLREQNKGKICLFTTLSDSFLSPCVCAKAGEKRKQIALANNTANMQVIFVLLFFFDASERAREEIA